MKNDKIFDFAQLADGLAHCIDRLAAVAPARYISVMSDDQSYDPAPEGWVIQKTTGTFSEAAGPYYWRTDGAPGVGFFSKPHHANGGGIIHGGALMTLADMALYAVCREAIGEDWAVTLTMNTEFLNPGPVGEFIIGEGEMVKGGRSIFFGRGLVRAGDTNLLAFSGSLKRVPRPESLGGSAKRRS